ncbi:MAG: coenzyme F390 synthetase [Methanomicrobiales archaeon]|nr:coenzyme F390 synthetase [Methanomicrobiales archaeon]
MGHYYREEIETLDRDRLDELIDERVRSTIKYAYMHSPFYRDWFRRHRINPGDIKDHQDLKRIPITSGSDIRTNQPPNTDDFLFRSAGWIDIFTIHQTSGTSGTPKSFFLTWEDWERYAEKYARIFLSQGLVAGDRLLICTSYGMNVGANTMTLAAKDLGITIIPIGKCTFPLNLLRSYRPTCIVGSVFKLLRLARRMRSEGLEPAGSGISRLIVGGEAFADESRSYLREVWGLPVYNTYGSTEGTMCGECTALKGLHVPEDLVHMDIYDPAMRNFVRDGECGRIVLTTLIPEGAKCGTLLINYDTEDTTVVLSRERCMCGRTHMRIYSPQREAETVWIDDHPFNRVDVERGVFQRESMEYLTGEYEAFLYSDEDRSRNVLRVSMECLNPAECDRESISERFIKAFLQSKPGLYESYREGTFGIIFNFTGPGELELHRIPGRPRRLVDRR